MTPASALKRRVAEALARSRLDYTDNVLILNAFLRDFCWRPGLRPVDARSRWEELRRAGAPKGHGFSVYIHVPYCVKKCHFCYCSVKASASRKTIDACVPELERELEFFAPALRGLPVKLLQVGGGTPNILSAGQLSRLLSRARRSFRLRPGGLRSIEFNPSAADEERLRAARDAGFNRISFGVQSLNPEVLERENREYQTYEMTRAAVEGAKRLGFSVVNVDLLLGLDGEQAGSFLDGFRKVAALAPTSITVTSVSVTDAYLKVNGLTRQDKLAFYERVLAKALPGMRGAARRAGYDAAGLTREHADWVLYRDPLPRAAARVMEKGDRLSGNGISVLGLGRLSWSHVFGRSIYERADLPFEPEAPIYREAPFTLKKEMMRHVLYCLEQGSRVEAAPFRARFGQDVRRAFAAELEALEALGKVRVDGEGFSFLPRRGPERVFYGSFFLLDALPAGRPA